MGVSISWCAVSKSCWSAEAEGRFEDRAELRIAASRGFAKLAGVPDTIEAEVLEIDGGPPPVTAPERARGGGEWSALRGRLLKFDRRWWPLWVLLGVLLLGLVFAFGALWLTSRLLLRGFRAVCGLLGLGGRVDLARSGPR